MYILVPDGPFCKPIQKLDIAASLSIIKLPKFRSAAFGYFGLMWELYAFWTFTPVILGMYLSKHLGHNFHISFLSFLIIGIGALGCIISAYLTQVMKTKRIQNLKAQL